MPSLLPKKRKEAGWFLLFGIDFSQRKNLKMKSSSQNAQILLHLQDFGSITPIQALEMYGCFRLGARIYDLRKQGVEIVSKSVEFVTKSGHRGSYASYSLVK